jgi:hypothetical protein
LELGAKLIPRNALFPVLLEPGDPPVEFGSLGLGHLNVLVVEALPKGLDQSEPLARREPGQSGVKSLMPYRMASARMPVNLPSDQLSR